MRSSRRTRRVGLRVNLARREEKRVLGVASVRVRTTGTEKCLRGSSARVQGERE